MRARRKTSILREALHFTLNLRKNRPSKRSHSVLPFQYSGAESQKLGKPKCFSWQTCLICMMMFEFSLEYTLQVGEGESDWQMKWRVLSTQYTWAGRQREKLSAWKFWLQDSQLRAFLPKDDKWEKLVFSEQATLCLKTPLCLSLPHQTLWKKLMPFIYLFIFGKIMLPFTITDISRSWGEN